MRVRAIRRCLRRIQSLALDSRRTLPSLLAFLALPSAAFAQNAIELENQLTGTTSWRLSGRISDDVNAQIQGFASDTSVDAGGSLDFYITLDPTGVDFSYSIDVYRMGWYGGDRGRLMASFTSVPGVSQPACPIIDPSPPAASVSGVGCHN